MISDIFKTSDGFAIDTRRCALAILVAMFVVTWTAPAQAQIARSWNAGDGNWSVGTNWAPIGVPGPLDGAFIGNLPAAQNAKVSLDQDDAVAGVQISNKASLDTLNHALVVSGNTSVSDGDGIPTGSNENSELHVRSVTGGIGYTTDDLTISDEGVVSLGTNAILRVLGVMDNVSGYFSGTGQVQLLGGAAVSFRNDGRIDPGPFSNGLTITQFGVGLIDLDGATGNGSVNATFFNSADPAMRSKLTINASELSDSFSGDMRLVNGAIVNMNISSEWTADSNSSIHVFNGTTEPITTPAQLTGDDVTLNGQVSVGSLGAGSGRLLVSANVTCEASAEVIIGTASNVQFTGSASVNGGSFTTEEDGNIDFNGATTVSGGTFNTHSISLADGDVDFNGPTTYSGNVTINGLAQQQGDATVTGATIISGDAFDMDGLLGDTTWDINTSLTVNVERIDTGASSFSGTFDIGGPTVARLAINLTDPQASWEMAGTMNLSGVPFGFANRVAGSKMFVTGQLNVQQRVDISADTTFAAASTTDINASSHVLQMSGVTVVEPGAAITGDGYLQNAATGNMLLPVGLSTGNVGLSNEGLLRLGDAVGVVSVAEFVQSDGATLVVDVGKNTVGTDSDVLTISSSAAFVAGFVQPNIVNIGGKFQPPQIGDTFTVLTAVGGVSNTFDQVLTSLHGGLIYDWDATYNPSNVVIELAKIVGLLGDYNGDGFVNAADYTVWHDTQGSSTNLAADGNLNGIIDQPDYDVWVANFGVVLGSGANEAMAVPEPASLMLLLLAAVGVSPQLRWRVRRS